MYDNPSDIVYQQLFDGIQPLLDANAEPLPETTVLAQYFQVTPIGFLSISADACITEFESLERLFLWD